MAYNEETARERAARDAIIARQRSSATTAAKVAVLRQQQADKDMEWISSTIKAQDKLNDDMEKERDKAREKANKAAGMPKTAPLSFDKLPNNKIADPTKSDAATAALAQMGSSGLPMQFAGGAEVRGTNAGIPESGGLVTREEMTNEVPINTGMFTTAMPLKSSRTTTGPRGMDDYQRAMVGEAEEKTGIARANMVIAQQQERRIAKKAKTDRLIQGSALGLTGQELIDYTEKSFDELSPEVQNKVAESWKRHADKQMDLEEAKNDISRLQIATRALEIDATLRRQKSSREPVGSGLTYGQLFGWIPNGKITQEQFNLRQSRVNKKIGSMSGKSFDKWEAGDVWEGLAVPMSSYGSIPVRIKEGELKGINDDVMGSAPVEDLLREFDRFYNPESSKSDKETAVKRLNNWGYIEGSLSQDNDLQIVDKGPMKIVAQRMYRAYARMDTLSKEFPELAGSSVETANSLLAPPPNAPQVNQETDKYIRRILDQVLGPME
jgi:hypothetical protein